MIAQLDMFSALEPPPPVQPLSPTRWEVLAVASHGEATEAKILASNSCGSLCDSGKVLRPFRFRNADWVQTGACWHRGNSDHECYRVVPLADFAGPGEPRTYHDHNFHGENRAALGGYHAMQAKLGRDDVVLIGPPIVLARKAHSE